MTYQGCVFCRTGEPTAYVCSRCVQKLLVLPQDKLKQAYGLAIEKGFHDKADFLNRLIEDEEISYDNRNAEESGPGVVGTGPMCKTQSAYRKDYRKKQAA